MLEANMLGQRNYNNTAPSSILVHLDGTNGTQAPSGANATAIPEATGNTQTGLYSSAKLTNALVAYGTTAADLSAAAASVVYCNPTKTGVNNHQADFTIEMYLGKKNATQTGLNSLCTDRWSTDLTTSYPSGGYPATSYNGGAACAMSYYFYIDTDGSFGYALQGLSSTASNWYTLRTNTGINFWSQLSASKMTHVLFQMRNKMFEGYLNGVRQFQFANPNWTGTPYSAQLDIGNSYTLTNNSKDLYFDEVRYTKGTARAKGNFAPPTAAFTV